MCAGHIRAFLFTLLMAVLLTLGVPSVHGVEAQDRLRIGIIPHRSHMGNETAYSPLIDALKAATSYRQVRRLTMTAEN